MFAFRLFLVRHQDVVGLCVDDITAVDDFLAALHKSCSQRNTVMEFVEARLTALFVVGEVWFQIVIEVTLLQDVAVFGQSVVNENLFVCRDDGVDFRDRHTGGVLAVNDADEACGVLM